MRQPDRTRLDGRRLLSALLLSTLIHAALLVPWRGWLRDPAPIVVLPHLQAQITTPKPAPPGPKAQPETQPKPPASPPKAPRQSRPVTGAQAQWAVAPGAEKSPVAEPPAPEPPPPAPPEPLVEALVTDRPTPPEYPPEARSQGLEGCVLAAVSVAADGSVSGVDIVAADLPGVFDQSVIDSQKNARYLPARRGAEQLPSRVLAVAAFVLTPERQLNCALRFAETARRLIGASVPAPGGER